MNQQTGYDMHRMVDARKAAEWAIEHRPRVAWFRVRCCYWDRQSNEEHFLFRSCTALIRILWCLGPMLFGFGLKHGRSGQSVQRMSTMLPHPLRVDGCMCGMRESKHGDLIWKLLRIQSNSVQMKKCFVGLRCSHPYRHEECPEDPERNQYPRALARRAARGIMQFEHTADKIVDWLKEKS